MEQNMQSLLRQKLAAAMARPEPLPKPPSTSVPAAANPAIAYCIQAYAEALQAALDDEQTPCRAENAGKAAYRSAMPPLSGSRNIRDFVACVAHAMAIDIMRGEEAARLLYAAQVASTAQSTQRRIKAKSNAITAPQTPQNRQLPQLDSSPKASTIS
jgi:hypothetical protein